jgi:hypothetical protein
VSRWPPSSWEACEHEISIVVVAMPVFVMAAVQAVVVMLVIMVIDIHHISFDDGALGSLGRNSRTRGAANGAPDDGPVASADGRTHGGSGAAAKGAADDGVAIDATGEGGRCEDGQGQEYECLLACHVDPFK